MRTEALEGVEDTPRLLVYLTASRVVQEMGREEQWGAGWEAGARRVWLSPSSPIPGAEEHPHGHGSSAKLTFQFQSSAENPEL